MSSSNTSDNSHIENQSGGNYISLSKEEEEGNKFIDPVHEIQWKNFFQDSYYFKQDIERVWIILRSLEVLLILCSQGHYPCIFIKGKDTWTKGNEFKGNIFGRFPFIGKVRNCSNMPEIKKIEWIIHLRNKYIFIIIELFKVTEDNSTVVIKQIKSEKEPENNDEIVSIQMIEKKLFEKIDKILETEPINLLKYESAIINGKMEDIWNIITDFNKLNVIAPNNNYLPNISIKDMKIEDKKEVSAFLNDEIRKIDITLKCKDEKPGWHKWLIVCEVSGGNPIKMPRHIILFQLTKISNSKCQLTLLTKFHEPIATKEFKEIVKRQKYLLLSIKDYFDNFYAPNPSN
jgi:hypothetical protein